MSTVALAKLKDEMRHCRRCLNAGYPIIPRPIFSGPASAKVMIIGQAPGIREVDIGLPFSGPAGKRLFSWLAQAGFKEQEFRATQYITAITKCYPGKKGSRGDRVPSAIEQRLCAPFLARELGLVAPKLIIPVGRVAIARFLGRIRLDEAIGNVYERDRHLILPLPHSSGANLWLNRSQSRDLIDTALAKLNELKKELSV